MAEAHPEQQGPSPLVSVVRCPTYDLEVVRARIAELLAPLGGMGAFVGRGERVHVKPNFLLSARVERAVTTHPAVIQAVVESVLDAGAASVTVGDSPAIHSGRKVARKLDLPDRLAALGVPVVELDDSTVVDNPEGDVFKRLELSHRLLDADKIINLPKLKTHAQMSMTLGVKNMFGAVVGTRKAAWHMEAGRDALLFARMLVDVYRRVRPALTIADGVIAMEGNGPSGGVPRTVGVLAASGEGAPLDQYLCELVGFPADQLPTLQALWERDGGPIDLGGGAVVGPPLDELRVDDFVHARPAGLGNLPGPLKRLVRRLLEVRPLVDREACVGCDVCAEHCPADAIAMRERNGRRWANIERTACVHCFVCQEICPASAIGVGRGLVRRLIR